MKIIRPITHLLFLLICLTFNNIAHSTQNSNTFYAPIYHQNGNIAWSGHEYSPFYHDNYSIAWGGLKAPYTPFSYKNGLIAWDGYLYHECGYNTSSAIVYHMNGSKAWKGASCNDCLFSTDGCAVYHDNGQKAWDGFLSKDCVISYANCTVYHRNGNIAWRGVKREELAFSSSPAEIYHANGTLAWRGGFSKNGEGFYASALYYENGQLAWSGRSTDPIYDPNGHISIGRTDSINLPLGENSLLQVYANGTWYLFISLGNESFLRFSNQDENPELCITIGPGYRLLFSPRMSTPAKLQVYDRTFLIN